MFAHETESEIIKHHKEKFCLRRRQDTFSPTALRGAPAPRGPRCRLNSWGPRCGRRSLHRGHTHAHVHTHPEHTRAHTTCARTRWCTHACAHTWCEHTHLSTRVYTRSAHTHARGQADGRARSTPPTPRKGPRDARGRHGAGRQPSFSVPSGPETAHHAAPPVAGSFRRAVPNTESQPTRPRRTVGKEQATFRKSLSCEI